MNMRYYDFVDNRADEPERTAEDIIKSVSDALDSLGKEEGEEYG